MSLSCSEGATAAREMATHRDWDSLGAHRTLALGWIWNPASVPH